MKYATNMHKTCHKYAVDMHEYVLICTNMQGICYKYAQNMHTICIKYADICMEYAIIY
jgi:hypothetical protein